MVSERGGRWQSSDLTFGPVGRVVCTLLLLAVPLWFLQYGGLFGIVGAVVWCGWVLPRAWRDVWRRAALPATDLTVLRDETRRRLAEEQRERPPHPAFDQDAPPPPRW